MTLFKSKLFIIFAKMPESSTFQTNTIKYLRECFFSASLLLMKCLTVCVFVFVEIFSMHFEYFDQLSHKMQSENFALAQNYSY